MAGARRVVRYVVLALGVFLALALAAVVVLSRTGFGVERTGRFVVERLERSINGTLSVERFTSQDLLSGVTLHGVEIVDEDGRRFVAADSAHLAYTLRSFLSGSVVFDRLALYGPHVVIERLPGDDAWNYQQLFRDTATVDTGRTGGLILIEDGEVHDGRVTVRLPTTPGASGDTSRLILESVPGGRVRTLRFEELDGRLPRVVWASPERSGQLIEIDQLSGRAFIWTTPVEVDSLTGRVTIQDSVVRFRADRARLPSSELRLEGRVVMGSERNRYELEAVGSDVALADFRWLYPSLPADGGGSLRFTLRTLEDGSTLFLAEDAKLTSSGTELAGSFGVVAGETLRFTDVDVRATPLDLEFLAGFLPTPQPWRGLVIGTLRGQGPLTALDTEADIRYRTFDTEGNGAESEIRWDGVVGTRPPYALRDLEVELRSVELEQLAHFAPGLRLRGTARGTLRANGSLEGGVTVAGDVSLDHPGGPSSVSGSGRLAMGDVPTFDLQFDAEPVALELLAQQYPAFEGLGGDARGPVTASGSLDDLELDADLMTPAGDVVVRGALSLAGPEARYSAEGTVTEFSLDRVVPGLPETVVSSRFQVTGSGFRPATMQSRVAADILTATYDDLEVHRGVLRGEVVDGVARLDSFHVATEVGDAGAKGSFGLVEGRTGELDVRLRADSLVFLEPLIFRDASPTDLGLDQASRLDGTITASGRVSGSLYDWRATGTARARSFLYEELELGNGRVDVTWAPDSLRLVVSMDSVRYGSRRLASVRGQGAYVDGKGAIEADLRGRQGQRLRVGAAFEPQGEIVGLDVWELKLGTRYGDWSLADTTRATVGGNGVWVDSLILARDPGPSRIRVSGALPWRNPAADEVQEASMVVGLDRVRIGEFLRVTQTDTVVGGLVTGQLRVDGTALHPELEGELSVDGFRYASASLDSVRAKLAYAERRVEGSVFGWRDGRSILTGRLQVPVDMRLTQVEDRRLDEPMDLRFRADGVPAALLMFPVPGFRDVAGQVDGEVNVVGTPVSPDLQGSLQLTGGAAFFQPLGVAYREVELIARMAEGTGVELDGRVRTEHGSGQVAGTVDFATLTDPSLDLAITADELDATRRRDVTAVVDGEAQLRGRYSRPVVSGDLFIVRGEMNLDEIWRQYQIVQLDTTLFQMLDTTQVRYRPEPGSPFLENLQVTNTTVTTQNGFWLRSQELNVEVGGTLSLAVDRQSDDFRLTGTLEVIEGSYRLLARGVTGGRRFTIRDGSIEFVGTPGIDPNLDIEAAYRVRRAQGDPIDVIAQVTGTLQAPRVDLSSNSEIPMSDTELASYVLFGRAGAELTQAELDIASGGSLAVGLFRPVVSGVAASELQRVASSLGLPVDYVAFTLPEYGVSEYGAAWESGGGALGLFQDAQLEIGFDPAPNVSVIGSVRFRGTEPGQSDQLRLSGARIEYRPWETWTLEGYLEDQFARRPSFGPAEISDRKVLGLSLFREWGY